MKSPDGGCVIEYVEVVGDTLDLSVTYEDKFGRPFDLTDHTATLDIFLPDIDTTVPLLTLPVTTSNGQRNLEVLVSPADTIDLGKGLFRSQLKLIDNIGKVNSLILGKITLIDPNSSSLRLPNKPSGGNRVVIENNKLSIRLEATQGLRGATGTPHQFAFSWGDVSPNLLMTLPADKVVLKVEVIITTPFNVSSTLSVGGIPDDLFPSDNVDTTSAATYQSNPNKLYVASSEINLYLSVGGGTSAGSGFVLIYLQG